MKKLLLLITLSIFEIANPIKVGDTLANITLQDQFETKQTVANDTKTILVAYDKDISSLLKEFLLSKEGDFLSANNAVYIGDIRGMPSLIARFFAIPKMKKYPFKILFLDEANENFLDKKEDMITVYQLTDGKISNVSFVKTTEELENLFN